MRFLKAFISVTVLIALGIFVGCEDWESVDDDSTWDSSVGWVNFSAVYRGESGEAVKEFSIGNSSAGADDADQNLVVVNAESGGLFPLQATALSGTLGHFPGIVDGSVSLVFSGTSSSGTFTDNGGVLSGTFNLLPVSPADKVGTGTIDYNTGVWSLTLESPGFLSVATQVVSYVYDAAAAGEVEEGSASTSNVPATAGGDVFSLQVIQTGNQITIRDNNGYSFYGQIFSMQTAGGDTTGERSGRVTAVFEATGIAHGTSVTITGTLSGNWIAPTTSTSGGSSGGTGSSSGTTTTTGGTLSDLLLEGVWIEPTITSDIRAVADGDTPSETTAAAVTTEE